MFFLFFNMFRANAINDKAIFEKSQICSDFSKITNPGSPHPKHWFTWIFSNKTGSGR